MSLFIFCHSKERMVLESDSVDLDDVKFGGLEIDSTESTTRLSSPDSSRQSVSQDSGVVSDIDVKDYDNSTTISNDPNTSKTTTNNKTNWNTSRYSRHNSMSFGRNSSISNGDNFSSRSGSGGSSEDSDSTDAGSEPSLSSSYPNSPASIRSSDSSLQKGDGR